MHLDKTWNWFAVSSNPNITLNIVNTPAKKYLKWNAFLSNPNITLEFMGECLDSKFAWFPLSWNLFDKHPHLIKKQKEKDQKRNIGRTY